MLHCCVTMVAIKVKVQRRPSARAKYETIAITLPKIILDAIPELKKAKYVELDVKNGKIIVSKSK